MGMYPFVYKILHMNKCFETEVCWGIPVIFANFKYLTLNNFVWDGWGESLQTEIEEI